LPAVPTDPYDGKAFRYRVSRGEKIDHFDRWQAMASPRQLPPGQAVLWSVGKDGVDNGGRSAGPEESGKDLIFLVQPPAK
jgi:hypothetical protein